MYSKYYNTFNKILYKFVVVEATRRVFQNILLTNGRAGPVSSKRAIAATWVENFEKTGY